MKKIIILLLIINVFEGFAAQKTVYNSSDYIITDNCSAVSSTAIVSGIDSKATITGVDLYFEIDHNRWSDLTIWLTAYYNGGWHDHILYNQGSLTGYGTMKISKTNLSIWNGASPNQTWYLSAKDCVTGTTGYIGFFQIWVNYETCSLSVLPEALSFTPLPGSKQFNVTSNSSWTVSDNSSWITVSPSSGTGNGTVTVNVAENTATTGTTQRVGTVTITGCNSTKTVLIMQDPCNIAVSTEALSFTPLPGSKQFNVTSNGSWTVSDNSPWITFSPSSGTGNKTVTVNVTENTTTTGTTQRVGTVTITGCNSTKTVLIMQDPCNIAVSTEALSFTTLPGSKQFNITSNGSWTISNNSPWITFSPSSGTGNGTVTANVTENTTTTGTTQRVGAVTITGCNSTKTVLIMQDPCNIAVSTEALSFNPFAGSKQFTVTATGSWTVSDNSAWITVSPSSGTGNGTITVNVTEHTGSLARAGSVTVTGCNTTKTVVVIQDEACNFSISAEALTFNPLPGSKQITVTSNGSWTVSDNSAWITVSPSSGTGNGTVTVNVTENTATTGTTQRVGTVTITGCNSSKTVLIMQDPCNIAVSTEALSFNPFAGSKQFAVTATGSWTVSDNSAWITVSPSSGTGNGTVAVNVTENTATTGTTQRVGTVTITGCNSTKTVLILQDPCNIAVSSISLNFSDMEGSKQISVTSNSSWTATDNSDWITVSPLSGTGNGTVTVNVLRNAGSIRSGEVTIIGCSSSKIVNIKQAEIISSINNNKNEPLLQVYPNPVTDRLNIKFMHYVSRYQIEIYSNSGLLIVKKESNMMSETVDLSSFPKGIYYLKLFNMEYSVLKKIIHN